MLAIVSWTWLTLAALMIFQSSMRRAKIRNAHLLRCAIYGCDFPFLLGAIAIIFIGGISGDSQILYVAIICPRLPALYRLYFAYRLYLAIRSSVSNGAGNADHRLLSHDGHHGRTFADVLELIVVNENTPTFFPTSKS